MTAARPSRIVELGALDGRMARFTLAAEEAERAAIAEDLGLPALTRLVGEFEITPTADGADIVIAVKALAERICVVSLEPMTETIDERYKLRLDRRHDAAADDDADDEWTREPLQGEALDLGDLLVQHLSLSLDPHPRKPGARSILDDYCDAASDSPFAVLKGLVDRDG